MAVSNVNASTRKEELHQQFFILDSTQAMNKNYEIGLVITTFNRPYYLHRTLSSLRKNILADTVILLIDDKSTNIHTLKLLIQFELENVPIIKFFRKEKEGSLMFENLQIGWEYLLTTYNCRYLANLDSDALVKPNWLLALKNLHQAQKSQNCNALVTGFNAIQHAIAQEAKDFHYKQSIGGINFFFDESLYRKIIKPSLVDLAWDHQVVAAMQANELPIVCTKPSVVQHIGRTGVWSGIQSGTFDFAIDFGDTNPLRMKLRLFWYTYSKKILRYGANKLLAWKFSLASFAYGIFFNSIYTNKKKRRL